MFQSGFGSVKFYESCDCLGGCDEFYHHHSSHLASSYNKRKKVEFTLPAKQGMVCVEAMEPWSLEAKRVR